MLGASLEPGIDLVLDAVGFDSRCAAADLVLTGEGRLDPNSRRGKACVGVARAARALGIPVVALVGEVAPGEDFGDLFDRVISLSERYGVERSLAEPETLLAEVAGEAVGAPVQIRKRERLLLEHCGDRIGAASYPAFERSDDAAAKGSLPVRGVPCDQHLLALGVRQQ